MKNNLNAFDWVIGALLVVGGVNWGLIGLFEFNLVSTLFGEMTLITRAVYALVGVSAIYVAGSAIFASTNASHHRVAHQSV